MRTLHDADPDVVRHHAHEPTSRSRRAPGLFRYWAAFTDGDAASSLLRYDRSVTGAVLRTDSRWRWSDRPERNVWLGSDYG